MIDEIDSVNSFDQPPVEERAMSVEELDKILRLQQSIFAQVAGNAEYIDTLNALCSMAEQLLPDSVASVMLRDEQSGLLNVLVAPSVPQQGVDALQGLAPGPGSGSCGNAVMRNEPVFVRDTFNDPRWQDLRQLAHDFNLRACWSMPVRNNDGKVIGSFALSSFEQRAPSAFHIRLLDVGASMVNIVLAKQYQEQALEEQRKQLITALECDSLTALPNQSKLKVQLKNCIAMQSLLLINLDNFRFINTAYGPSFGDLFLCQVAQMLQQQFPEAELYRINADEFALYYRLPTDLQQQIERFREYLFGHPLKIDDQLFSVTFTAGGASGRKNLLEQAVQAMSQAKARGKNRYHIYDAERDEPDQALRREYIRWNAMLHQALNEGRVKPYFQGVRDNSSGDIVSYEALVRLEDSGKVYTPYHFFNAVRLSGLFPTITRLVIDKGLAEIAGSGLILSVNITEDDLLLEYLEAYLTEKTAAYGVAPEQVVLEILEGISSSGKKNHIAQLIRLKDLGYKLAIDDFGTEYSNFERLLELHVDFVKIDAKYIKNIATDRKSYEITRAIVFFARNAGIKTVAEFVHNDAVQQVVESLGIDYSQGYLFSEPVAKIAHDHK
ncbi:diguanylate cyclase (GGDEF) domain-containing protein [Amphritea atlantica]|uniref:Diguanylate cyclase (GGDEF) domain-containing protein n=1 Tax=Amphritea atlantica TaxID=355243 RepID=A0A1H9L2A7_9GAMM|nr:EAL domain-containing protein [Amphritea atlantica]SER05285.1 diguanylate cyclase (GGDEF) domain-containing protein [Amphritea atlantica]